jgi:hypothetical protein
MRSRKRPHATAPDGVPCDVIPLIALGDGLRSLLSDLPASSRIITFNSANEKFVVDKPHIISFFKISRWRNVFTYARTSEV